MPLLVAVAFWQLVRSLRGGATYAPYLWTVALFLLGYAGLLIGIFPYLVPYGLTTHLPAAYILGRDIFGWPGWLAFISPLSGLFFLLLLALAASLV